MAWNYPEVVAVAGGRVGRFSVEDVVGELRRKNEVN